MRGWESVAKAVVGDLVLDWDTLIEASDAGQQLVVWTAESGCRSHDALRMLASWASTDVDATRLRMAG